MGQGALAEVEGGGLGYAIGDEEEARRNAELQLQNMGSVVQDVENIQRMLDQTDPEGQRMFRELYGPLDPRRDPVEYTKAISDLREQESRLLPELGRLASSVESEAEHANRILDRTRVEYNETTRQRIMNMMKEHVNRIEEIEREQAVTRQDLTDHAGRIFHDEYIRQLSPDIRKDIVDNYSAERFEQEFGHTVGDDIREDFREWRDLQQKQYALSLDRQRAETVKDNDLKKYTVADEERLATFQAKKEYYDSLIRYQDLIRKSTQQQMTPAERYEYRLRQGLKSHEIEKLEKHDRNAGREILNDTQKLDVDVESQWRLQHRINVLTNEKLRKSEEGKLEIRRAMLKRIQQYVDAEVDGGYDKRISELEWGNTYRLRAEYMLTQLDKLRETTPTEKESSLRQNREAQEVLQRYNTRMKILEGREREIEAVTSALNAELEAFKNRTNDPDATILDLPNRRIRRVMQTSMEMQDVDDVRRQQELHGDVLYPHESPESALNIQDHKIWRQSVIDKLLEGETVDNDLQRIHDERTTIERDKNTALDKFYSDQIGLETPLVSEKASTASASASPITAALRGNLEEARDRAQFQRDTLLRKLNPSDQKNVQRVMDRLEILDKKMRKLERELKMTDWKNRRARGAIIEQKSRIENDIVKLADNLPQSQKDVIAADTDRKYYVDKLAWRGGAESGGMTLAQVRDIMDKKAQDRMTLSSDAREYLMRIAGDRKDFRDRNDQNELFYQKSRVRWQEQSTTINQELSDLRQRQERGLVNPTEYNELRQAILNRRSSLNQRWTDDQHEYENRRYSLGLDLARTSRTQVARELRDTEEKQRIMTNDKYVLDSQQTREWYKPQRVTRTEMKQETTRREEVVSKMDAIQQERRQYQRELRNLQRRAGIPQDRQVRELEDKIADRTLELQAFNNELIGIHKRLKNLDPAYIIETPQSIKDYRNEMFQRQRQGLGDVTKGQRDHLYERTLEEYEKARATQFKLEGWEELAVSVGKIKEIPKEDYQQLQRLESQYRNISTSKNHDQEELMMEGDPGVRQDIIRRIRQQERQLKDIAQQERELYTKHNLGQTTGSQLHKIEGFDDVLYSETGRPRDRDQNLPEKYMKDFEDRQAQRIESEVNQRVIEEETARRTRGLTRPEDYRLTREETQNIRDELTRQFDVDLEKSRQRLEQGYGRFMEYSQRLSDRIDNDTLNTVNYHQVRLDDMKHQMSRAKSEAERRLIQDRIDKENDDWRKALIKIQGIAETEMRDHLSANIAQKALSRRTGYVQNQLTARAERHKVLAETQHIKERNRVIQAELESQEKFLKDVGMRVVLSRTQKKQYRDQLLEQFREEAIPQRASYKNKLRNEMMNEQTRDGEFLYDKLGKKEFNKLVTQEFNKRVKEGYYPDITDKGMRQRANTEIEKKEELLKNKTKTRLELYKTERQTLKAKQLRSEYQRNLKQLYGSYGGDNIIQGERVLRHDKQGRLVDEIDLDGNVLVQHIDRISKEGLIQEEQILQSHMKMARDKSALLREEYKRLRDTEVPSKELQQAVQTVLGDYTMYQRRGLGKRRLEQLLGADVSFDIDWDRGTLKVGIDHPEADVPGGFQMQAYEKAYMAPTLVPDKNGDLVYDGPTQRHLVPHRLGRDAKETREAQKAIIEREVGEEIQNIRDALTYIKSAERLIERHDVYTQHHDLARDLESQYGIQLPPEDLPIGIKRKLRRVYEEPVPTLETKKQIRHRMENIISGIDEEQSKGYRESIAKLRTLESMSRGEKPAQRDERYQRILSNLQNEPLEKLQNEFKGTIVNSILTVQRNREQAYTAEEDSRQRYLNALSVEGSTTMQRNISDLRKDVSDLRKKMRRQQNLSNTNEIFLQEIDTEIRANNDELRRLQGSTLRADQIKYDQLLQRNKDRGRDAEKLQVQKANADRITHEYRKQISNIQDNQIRVIENAQEQFIVAKQKHKQLYDPYYQLQDARKQHEDILSREQKARDTSSSELTQLTEDRKNLQNEITRLEGLLDTSPEYLRRQYDQAKEQTRLAERDATLAVNTLLGSLPGVSKKELEHRIEEAYSLYRRNLGYFPGEVTIKPEFRGKRVEFIEDVPGRDVFKDLRSQLDSMQQQDQEFAELRQKRFSRLLTRYDKAIELEQQATTAQSKQKLRDEIHRLDQEIDSTVSKIWKLEDPTQRRQLRQKLQSYTEEQRTQSMALQRRESQDLIASLQDRHHHERQQVDIDHALIMSELKREAERSPDPKIRELYRQATLTHARNIETIEQRQAQELEVARMLHDYLREPPEGPYAPGVKQVGFRRGDDDTLEPVLQTEDYLSAKGEVDMVANEFPKIFDRYQKLLKGRDIQVETQQQLADLETQNIDTTSQLRTQRKRIQSELRDESNIHRRLKKELELLERQQRTERSRDFTRSQLSPEDRLEYERLGEDFQKKLSSFERARYDYGALSYQAGKLAPLVNAAQDQWNNYLKNKQQEYSEARKAEREGLQEKINESRQRMNTLDAQVKGAKSRLSQERDEYHRRKEELQKQVNIREQQSRQRLQRKLRDSFGEAAEDLLSQQRTLSKKKAQDIRDMYEGTAERTGLIAQAPDTPPTRKEIIQDVIAQYHTQKETSRYIPENVATAITILKKKVRQNEKALATLKERQKREGTTRIVPDRVIAGEPGDYRVIRDGHLRWTDYADLRPSDRIVAESGKSYTFQKMMESPEIHAQRLIDKDRLVKGMEVAVQPHTIQQKRLEDDIRSQKEMLHILQHPEREIAKYRTRIPAPTPLSFETEEQFKRYVEKYYFPSPKPDLTPATLMDQWSEISYKQFGTYDLVKDKDGTWSAVDAKDKPTLRDRDLRRVKTEGYPYAPEEEFSRVIRGGKDVWVLSSRIREGERVLEVQRTGPREGEAGAQRGLRAAIEIYRREGRMPQTLRRAWEQEVRTAKSTIPRIHYPRLFELTPETQQRLARNEINLEEAYNAQNIARIKRESYDKAMNATLIQQYRVQKPNEDIDREAMRSNQWMYRFLGLPTTMEVPRITKGVTKRDIENLWNEKVLNDLPTLAHRRIKQADGTWTTEAEAPFTTIARWKRELGDPRIERVIPYIPDFQDAVLTETQLRKRVLQQQRRKQPRDQKLQEIRKYFAMSATRRRAEREKQLQDISMRSIATEAERLQGLSGRARYEQRRQELGLQFRPMERIRKLRDQLLGEQEKLYDRARRGLYIRPTRSRQELSEQLWSSEQEYRDVQSKILQDVKLHPERQKSLMQDLAVAQRRHVGTVSQLQKEFLTRGLGDFVQMDQKQYVSPQTIHTRRWKKEITQLKKQFPQISVAQMRKTDTLDAARKAMKEFGPESLEARRITSTELWNAQNRYRTLKEGQIDIFQAYQGEQGIRYTKEGMFPSYWTHFEKPLKQAFRDMETTRSPIEYRTKYRTTPRVNEVRRDIAQQVRRARQYGRESSTKIMKQRAFAAGLKYNAENRQRVMRIQEKYYRQHQKGIDQFIDQQEQSAFLVRQRQAEERQQRRSFTRAAMEVQRKIRQRQFEIQRIQRQRLKRTTLATRLYRQSRRIVKQYQRTLQRREQRKREVEKRQEQMLQSRQSGRVNTLRTLLKRYYYRVRTTLGDKAYYQKQASRVRESLERAVTRTSRY